MKIQAQNNEVQFTLSNEETQYLMGVLNFLFTECEQDLETNLCVFADELLNVVSEEMENV